MEIAINCILIIYSLSYRSLSVTALSLALITFSSDYYFLFCYIPFVAHRVHVVRLLENMYSFQANESAKQPSTYSQFLIKCHRLSGKHLTTTEREKKNVS